MEIWYDENSRSLQNTGVSYLPEVCAAIIQLQRQRKQLAEVDKLINRCVVIQQKINKNHRRALVGL